MAGWLRPCRHWLTHRPPGRRHLTADRQPPIDAPSLQQRLAVAPDFGVAEPPVDIGFSAPRLSQRRQMSLVERQNRGDTALALAARTRTLTVPLEQVDAEWTCTQTSHLQAVARYYGIYDSAFDAQAEFRPVVPLRVEYPAADGLCHVAARGNVIKPQEAAVAPDVSLHGAALEGTLWTLTCSCLEGSALHAAPETLHWLVQNIPDGDVSRGQQLLPYCQPLPVRGTGFHRMLFLLYKQTAGQRVDASSVVSAELVGAGKPPPPFSTADFYRQRQQHLTPAGLAFFQTDWDHSVQEHFHRVLARAEPAFEYEFRPPYVRRQRWFPAGESVQHFFDKYADPRDIQKQMLLKRLSMVHPFEGEKQPHRYPLAALLKRPVRPPTSVINEEKKEARRIGKYYFIDRRVSALFNPRC